MSLFVLLGLIQGINLDKCNHLIFIFWSSLNSATLFVLLCNLEHINKPGRSRERVQAQEGRSSTQINLHWMSQKKHSHFLGVRSHLLGEHHGNSWHGPQLLGLSFSTARSKVAGQVLLFCGVSWTFFCLSFLSLHDTVQALSTRETVRRLQRTSACGMLPDNPGACDSRAS